MKKLIIMPVFLKSVACSTFILFACLAFSSFLRASAAAPEPIDTDLKAASDYSEWFKIHQMCYNNKDVSVVGNYIDKLNLSKNDLALHLNRRDESGYSALDYAIMSGDILKVMLLLENGANPISALESTWGGIVMKKNNFRKAELITPENAWMSGGKIQVIYSR